VLVAVGKGEAVLQRDDVGGFVFKERVAISDIAAVQTPDATTFLRGDGVWAAPSDGGSATGVPAGDRLLPCPFRLPADWFAMGNWFHGWNIVAFSRQLAQSGVPAIVFTTFSLPDLRGEFLRGWDDNRDVDSGRVFVSG